MRKKESSSGNAGGISILQTTGGIDLKKIFKVKKKNLNKWDKEDEVETKYKAVMEEQVPKGETPDKLTLESSKPIDLQKKDEIQLQKVAFQKSLGKK